MPLQVVYVEDNGKDLEALQTAVKAANMSQPEWLQIKVTPVEHPVDLAAALNVDADVVLADVFFSPQKGVKCKPEDEVDWLPNVIETVRAWDKKSHRGFPLPVIAYTSKGLKALGKCLERGNELFDIWDKMSASAAYVAWRFQRLSRGLPRHRPDTTIQRLIKQMPPPGPGGGGLHEGMLRLVQAYGEGYTEYDQVQHCGRVISELVDTAIPKHWVAFSSLWEALSESEGLLRATSPTLRGVARHSINVLWLGYWLLNHPLLAPRFATLWKETLSTRRCPDEVREANGQMLMNTIWFFSCLFHDAGKFVENACEVVGEYNRFAASYSDLGLGQGTAAWMRSAEFDGLLEQLLKRVDAEEHIDNVGEVRSYVQNSCSGRKPDHGVVVGARMERIANSIKDPVTQFCVREAGRAAVLHSVMPAICSEERVGLSWETEVCACLLLLCDQIQTWDRQSAKEHYRSDVPERAELAYLEVGQGPGETRPVMRGCVNYIAPAHVEAYPGLLDRVGEDLDVVLKKIPKRNLLHAIKGGAWPFSVRLECAVSGQLLKTRLDFD
jgi:hypothetical protein